MQYPLTGGDPFESARLIRECTDDLSVPISPPGGKLGTLSATDDLRLSLDTEIDC
jgi:hypothetical protein